MEEIHYAAARGDLEVVLSELKKGVDVNWQPPFDTSPFELDEDLFDDETFEELKDLRESLKDLSDFREGTVTKTPLICAAENNRVGVKALKILLDAGANIDTKGGEVESCALGEALRYGPIEKVEFLIQRGADLNYVTSDGFNAWLDVAYNFTDSQEEIAELLLDKGINFDQFSDYSEHLLKKLSSRGLFKILKKVVDAGADVEALGWSELMWKVAYGSVADVEECLESEVDLAHKDSQEKTVWLLAAQVGDISKAKVLLEHGADIFESGPHGDHALFYALTNDHLHMLKWLISLGLDIEKKGSLGSTPLLAAAEKNATECLKYLLTNGADKKAVGEVYDNALNAASKIESIKILVDEGFDIDFIAGDGYSLLKSATEGNDLQLVKDLISLGADIEVTSTGDTALHKAICFDYLDIAEFLLSSGADPNAVDVDCETPLHYCKSRKAIDLLMNAGADKSIENMIGEKPEESLRADLRERLKKNWKKRSFFKKLFK